MMSLNMWKDKMLTWSMLRYVLALLTLLVVTVDYYSFSHHVHQSHNFHGPTHGHSKEASTSTGGAEGHREGSSAHEEPASSSSSGGSSSSHSEHHHGRGGGFDSIHMKVDGLFLYGLALPILLLTLAALIWNPSTSSKGSTNQGSSSISSSSNNDSGSDKKVRNGKGDVNVWKWTIICFVVPLYLVMLDGARGHSIFHASSTDEHFGWNLYVRVCMSLMSPSGYAATWALSLFLIPVTKHSPILDWLRITPIQALAFHRVSGWVSFWNSVLHGFLHLRHLMDVLNKDRARTWLQQLKFLLIPESWQCFEFVNPWGVFLGQGLRIDKTEEEANQCWLSLVNGTGMVSVLAFVALAITSLPFVRRYSYTLFYRVHIPSAWTMLVMAIWHYPTCALVLIPNILYYLSFHIPVRVTQFMDAWSRRRWTENDTNNKPHSSSLVEANWIQGGSIELIFAATPSDRQRHESRYARLFHPAISPLSHPFSIFSRDELKRHATMDDVAADHDESSSLPTISILLRPSGPFTEKLTKVLFSNDNDNDMSTAAASDKQGSVVERFVDSPPPDEIDAALSSSLLSSTHHMIQVDSYYAGSYDWIDHAMKSHDEILLVAGGVGIVPFLEFLPNLQQRIQLDTAARHTTLSTTSASTSSSDVPDIMESNGRLGPATIHLHWYCREIGLASYIWNNHLQHHLEQVWEKNPASQGRLKIHLHLTAMTTNNNNNNMSAAAAKDQPEQVFRNVPKSGLKEKQTYSTDVHTIHPVKDARLTQSWKIGLLLPGTLMVIGTILHWWWYKQFIINKKYHHDNLAIRSHSIVFTLVLAVFLSIPVEHYTRSRTNSVKKQGFGLLAASDEPAATTTVQEKQFTIDDSSTNGVDDKTLSVETATPVVGHYSCLTVSGGRPPIDTVISNVLEADRPGVYSCGPHALMKNVENSIRAKRKDCAFYREDSEM